MSVRSGCGSSGRYETAGFLEIEDESNDRAREVAALILQRLPSPGIVIPEGKFVYVCEPPGELEGEHMRLVNDLESELRKRRVSVIAAEFRRKPELIGAIPDLLAAASFVVQLHGKQPVPAPYSAFGTSIEYWLAEQLRRLCQAPQDATDRPPNKIPGRTWLRWRSDALKRNQITDDIHRAFVFDDDHHVYALSKVKFREFVVQIIERELQNEKLPEISESKVLIRSSANDAPGTGDLCDGIDTFSTDTGTRPLSAEIVLDDVALDTCCDTFRKKGLWPGGLFVVYELSPDPGEEWVSEAMRECRVVALKYKPTLPICLVYASKAQNDNPRLRSVPGRFRVVWYQPPNGGNKPAGPVDPEALNNESHESHLFSGRAEQVESMLHRMESSRFLSVIGASGCGKSFLVRAGLLPAVANGFVMNEPEHWRFVTIKPGDNPSHSLATGLLGRQTGEQLLSSARCDLALDSNEIQALERTLRRGRRSLLEFMSSRQENQPLLLLVDQFEELFRFRQEVHWTEGTGRAPGGSGSATMRLLSWICCLPRSIRAALEQAALSCLCGTQIGTPPRIVTLHGST